MNKTFYENRRLIAKDFALLFHDADLDDVQVVVNTDENR